LKPKLPDILTVASTELFVIIPAMTTVPMPDPRNSDSNSVPMKALFVRFAFDPLARSRSRLLLKLVCGLTRTIGRGWKGRVVPDVDDGISYPPPDGEKLGNLRSACGLLRGPTAAHFGRR
jgi:hypothetical protein